MLHRLFVHTLSPFIAWTLLFFTILPFATNVSAEEPSRGRLPDGRAFRTDVNGNEIVDYIAELELAVETMTRKVHGLEDEVEEKNAVIARLRSQGASDSTVTERDLLGDPNVPAKPEFVESNCELRLANQQKENLERISSCQNELNVLQAKLRRASDAANASAERTSHSVMEKSPEVKSAEPISRVARDSEGDRRASMKAPRSTERSVLNPASMKKKAQQDRALEMLKGSVKTSLNNLRGKLKTRSTLYTRYSKNGKNAVSISLRPAKAGNGRGVSELRNAIDQATNARVLSGAKRDIQEISSVVSDDIALLKRLLKVK